MKITLKEINEEINNSLKSIERRVVNQATFRSDLKNFIGDDEVITLFATNILFGDCLFSYDLVAEQDGSGDTYVTSFEVQRIRKELLDIIRAVTMNRSNSFVVGQKSIKVDLD